MSSTITLTELLSEHRDTIIDTWRDQILESYSDDYAKFLKKRKNRFANPVGFNLTESLNGLFDSLNGEFSDEVIREPLENIVKVRAIQELSVIQAVEFVFFLKGIIHDKLLGNIKENDLFKELFELELIIDRIALVAFEIYMESREKLYEIRANEWKRRSHKLLERSNLLQNIDDDINRE